MYTRHISGSAIRQQSLIDGITPDLVCLFFCFWRNSPQWVMASSFTRFLDHTRLTTVGRTPLEERSARRREFYLVAYPSILLGGGGSNSVEDRGQRERGSGGGSPLVRGSGGSCNLVQEISFHIVKFS